MGANIIEGINKMLEIITGLISGTVSGTGMGGGTILILILSMFMRSESAYSPSNKFSVFHTNINSCNNNNNKK